MAKNAFINKPIFIDEYDVDPSGDIDIDIERIRKESLGDNQEYGAVLVFKEYCKNKYNNLCTNPESVVEVYKKLKVLIKRQDKDYYDMLIGNLLFYLSKFNKISQDIYDFAENEHTTLNQPYEWTQGNVHLAEMRNKM